MTPYDKPAGVDPDIAAVTMRAINVTPLQGAGTLLGLADVEVVIGGVCFTLHGVQIRADSGKTEVRLPKYRATGGSWEAALSMPEEIMKPMGDIVINAALEVGILRHISEAPRRR